MISPRVQARFLRPLLENVLAIIERDTSDFLEFVAGEDGTPLPPFAAYDNSLRLNVNFPFLYAQPAASVIAESEDSTTTGQLHKIEIGIDVTGPDPTQLTWDLLDYMRAVSLILLGAAEEDLFYGIDCAPAEWDVTEHSYSEAGVDKSNSIYLRRARLTFAVYLEEFVYGTE